MKTINKFDDSGNFIFWEDQVTGADIVRRGYMSSSEVESLLYWIVLRNRPLKLYPRREISREQWGYIFAEIQERLEAV